MKVVFKLAVLGLVIGAVMNYAAYQKSGHMPLARWFADVKKSVGNWVGQDIEPTVKSPIKVSKWTDAKGVVHYENRPVDGAKTLDVDPDVNVLSLEPVAKIPEPAKPAAKTQEEEMRALQQAKDAYMEKLINN